MKTIILILSVLLVISAQSQIVNIPDANFKAYLVADTLINTNNDSEIQVSEANSFNGGINCFSLMISDLTGIEEFTSLTQLTCRNNTISNIDLSNNVNLTIFNCRYNQISSLDFSNCVNLKMIWCNNNNISSLNISNCSSLNFLSCQFNQLDSLDISNNPLLEKLYCYDNSIEGLNIGHLTNLEKIQCANNEIPTLDFSNSPLLTSIHCSSNLLNSIDISTNLQLEYIFCAYNNIEILDVTNNHDLKKIGCYNNQIKRIDASNASQLIEFVCEENQLEYINVKNGNNQNLYFRTHDNPNIICVEVDDVVYSDTTWTVANGLIDSTTSFSLTCYSDFTSVTKNDISNQVNIYPNPSNGFVNVDLNNLKNATIKVISLEGKLLLSKQNTANKTTLNLENFSKGIYLIKVITKNASLVKKVIID